MMVSQTQTSQPLDARGRYDFAANDDEDVMIDCLLHLLNISAGNKWRTVDSCTFHFCLYFCIFLLLMITFVIYISRYSTAIAIGHKNNIVFHLNCSINLWLSTFEVCVIFTIKVHISAIDGQATTFINYIYLQRYSQESWVWV